MRKVLLSFLFIATIFGAACESPQEAKPSVRPRATPTEVKVETPRIIKSLQISNGRVVETTHKIYGPLPKDCEEAARLKVPCFTEKTVPQSAEPRPTLGPRLPGLLR